MTDVNESNELLDEEVDLFADDVMDVVATPTPEPTEPEVENATEDEDDDQSIPDKFKGKGITEVIDSYTQLEREFGRRSNEVSDMRKTLDDILKQQLAGNTDVNDVEDEDAAAIEAAVANSPTLAAVQNTLAEQTRNAQRAEFDKVHPDAEKVIASKAFVKWVTDSNVRTKQFANANTGYDYETIAEMLGTYTELSSVRKTANTKKRDGTLKALETPNANGGEGAGTQQKRKVFKLSDLMKLRETDPGKYEKLGPVINKAYAEGRVLRDK